MVKLLLVIKKIYFSIKKNLWWVQHTYNIDLSKIKLPWHGMAWHLSQCIIYKNREVSLNISVAFTFNLKIF